MLFGPVSQGQSDELRTIVCSERTTRSAVRLKSTAIASASRLESCTTLNVRKRRPSHNVSLMKSADQHSIIVCVTASGAGLRVDNLRLPLRRLFSFSPQYTRYTRLWFQR